MPAFDRASERGSDDIFHSVVTQAVTEAAANWTSSGAKRICVALSGGLDSTVLLHVLSGLVATQSDWQLSAHHVHHGLSRSADTWAAHCGRVCAALDVSFTYSRVTVSRDRGMGIEGAARDARYAALDAIAADVIALAHHARDQAETVLLQMMRGSGPNGLAAMPRLAHRYVRPLLGVPRSAIHAYALAHGLTWVDDESNLDTRFSRNRLRLKVWPALEAAFPRAEATLARASTLQAEASVLLRDLAILDLQAISEASVPRVTGLLALSRERRANALRHWLATNSLPVPSSDTLHEWLKQLTSTNATQSILLGFAKNGPKVRVYRDQLLIEHPIDDWPAQPWFGEAEITLGQLAGQVLFSDAAQDKALFLRRPVPGETWRIRKRQAGDRVKLSDASGHVTLKNVMQGLGVPPWLRDVWPLVTCDDHIAAIAGLLIANDYQVRRGECGLICEWKPAWGHPLRS